MKRTLRVPAQDLSIGRIELDEETSRYVVKVRRLAVDDEVELFDPQAGIRASARVVSDRLPRVSVEVFEEPSPSPNENLPITVIQALGKGDKPEQAVRDATVFGAERVLFVPSERSMAKGQLKMDRLARVAAQVARQCQRGDLPSLQFQPSLAEVFSQASLPEQRIVCGWGEDAVPLLDAVTTTQTREGVALLIGPEGGLTQEEIRQSVAHEFRLVSLGPYVLRTEVAVGAVLSALRARDLSA